MYPLSAEEKQFPECSAVAIKNCHANFFFELANRFHYVQH
jgi:hypothetical protein